MSTTTPTVTIPTSTTPPAAAGPAPVRLKAAGRPAAWAGIVLGGCASVAANLAHALYVQPNPSPVTIISALLWPLFTLLGFEVIIRPPWPVTGWRSILWWLFRLAAVTVGVVAVVTSYEHMSGLLRYAEDNAFAVTFGPVAIDGLMVTSAAALLAIERAEARLAQAATTPAPATGAAGNRPAGGPRPARKRAAAQAGPARPTRTKRPAGPRSTDTGTAEAVARLRAEHPDMTAADIAARLGVTDRTVRRHLAVTPAEPLTDPAVATAEPPAEPIEPAAAAAQAA
jgi:DNA-binding transcriptional ArsR family regulator